MKSYVLRIELPLSAPDDPAARKRVELLLRQLGVPADAEVKLQERFPDKAPRPVTLFKVEEDPPPIQNCAGCRFFDLDQGCKHPPDDAVGRWIVDFLTMPIGAAGSCPGHKRRAS